MGWVATTTHLRTAAGALTRRDYAKSGSGLNRIVFYSSEWRPRSRSQRPLPKAPGKDIEMIIQNGFVAGCLEIASDLVRRNAPLRACIWRRLGA